MTPFSFTYHHIKVLQRSMQPINPGIHGGTSSLKFIRQKFTIFVLNKRRAFRADNYMYFSLQYQGFHAQIGHKHP